MRQFLRQVIALNFLLLPLCAMAASPEAVAKGEVTGARMSVHPNWFKESFLEISEDLEEASEYGKHVILYFEFNGCPYCYRTIEDNFKHAPYGEFIQQNFDVIALNVFGDREVALDQATSATEKEIASRLNVVYYPTLVILNSDNQTVLRMAGYRNRPYFRAALDYVQQRAYEQQTLASFINARNKKEVYRFRDHPQIQNISDLTSVGDRPLAILFESNDCLDCDRLHDTHLSDPEIREILKGFTLVRLDALADTPVRNIDGKVTTARALSESMGITYRPSIVLFDRGREILRIENLLYRYHFAGVLEYVGQRHYEKYPDSVWDYVDAKTERLVAAGQNVSLSDE